MFKKVKATNPYAENYYDEIVDRSVEIGKLSATVKEGNATAYLFFSTSGTGKSSLTLKFLRKIDVENDGLPIRVKMSPKNSTNYEEGAFLYSIFEELIRVIKHLRKIKRYRKLSFEYYVTHCKDKALKRRLLENFIDPVFDTDNVKNSFLRRLLFYFIKRIFRLGEFNYINILKENTLENRMLIAGYIKYVLCKERAILNIDNIQNIDNHSFKFLLDWINESKKLFPIFLFEYTLSENNTTQDLQCLLESIRETGVKTRYVKLTNLESTDAIVIIRNTSEQPLSKTFEDAAQEYYHNSANGNIRELIDFQITYEEGNNTIEGFDATLENIKSLDKHEKQILAILNVLNGRIELSLLRNIMVPEFIYDSSELEQIIKRLSKNKKLVEKKQSTIEIIHASILDTWEKSLNTDFNLYNSIACRRLSTILRKQFDTKDTTYYSLGQVLLYLFNVYTIIDITELYSLVYSLDSKILDSINSHDLLHFMKLLIDFTHQNINTNEKLYEKIVKICYEYEMYEDGLSLLEHMKLDATTPSKFLLYKNLFLTELSYFNIVIGNIESLRGKEEKGTRIWLILTLILIINYRKLNMVDKCIEFSKEVEKYDYSTTLEYGYYLRLKAIFMPRNIGKKFVEKSVAFFEVNNDRVQLGKSQISLSYYLAICGNIEQSYKCITKAEKNLKNAHVSNHILENNKAAIDLLSSRCGNSVWESLEKAELSATKPFDFLAIANNKLVWCIENFDFDKCDLLVNKIERLLKYVTDKHMHAFINYNLYLLFKSKGMQNRAETYYKTAFELKEYCHTLKCRLLNIQPNDQTTFLLSKPWHICFLTHWCFDLY